MTTKTVYSLESSAGSSIFTSWCPSANDFAMLKTVRGYAHDLDAVEALHHRKPLELVTLIDRYRSTATQAIGDPKRLRANFLALVARLYGDEAADTVETQLKVSRA